MLPKGAPKMTSTSPSSDCRGRAYWTLACPQSTCSGWDGGFSQRRSSIVDSSVALPPAGFLHTDTRVHHKVTQDSPSRGAVTGHSKQASTHAHNAAKQRESQTASAHYNDPVEYNHHIPTRRHTHLTHYTTLALI